MVPVSMFHILKGVSPEKLLITTINGIIIYLRTRWFLLSLIAFCQAVI